MDRYDELLIHQAAFYQALLDGDYADKCRLFDSLVEFALNAFHDGEVLVDEHRPKTADLFRFKNWTTMDREGLDALDPVLIPLAVVITIIRSCDGRGEITYKGQRIPKFNRVSSGDAGSWNKIGQRFNRLLIET